MPGGEILQDSLLASSGLPLWLRAAVIRLMILLYTVESDMLDRFSPGVGLDLAGNRILAAVVLGHQPLMCQWWLQARQRTRTSLPVASASISSTRP